MVGIDRNKLNFDSQSHEHQHTCLCQFGSDSWDVVVVGSCVLSSLGYNEVCCCCCCTLSNFGFTWTDKLQKSLVGFNINNLKSDLLFMQWQ